MMGFFLGVGVLCLLAAGVLLLRKPNVPRVADSSDPNLGWYVQRESELQGEDSKLLDDARLRLLEDADAAAPSTPSAMLGSRHLALGLLVSVLAIAGILYQQTGSLEDVLIYEELSQLTPEDSDATREALLLRIAARSRQKQDNLQYLGLLGQLYMAGEDFSAAKESFGLLAEKAPEDPQALAMAAQARFLAADRQLDADAQLLAERALAVDPEQRTALGLLGMASFEAGAYSAAINYWRRLQVQEDKGTPGHEMLEQVIAAAQQRGGIGEQSDARPEVQDDGAAPGVSVVLMTEQSLDPNAAVFVFARRAGAKGGMPIAVRRLRGADLPITLRLSDGDSMAGQLLSEAGEVEVSAQVSVNGQPGLANAAFSGTAEPVTAGGPDVGVKIELRSVGQGD